MKVVVMYFQTSYGKQVELAQNEYKKQSLTNYTSVVCVYENIYSEIQKNLVTVWYINELRNDNSIIIKEADKGGAVVVMDMDFYCSKIQEMINDTNFYEEISSNADLETRKLINKLIQKYKNNLYEEEVDYLTVFEHSTSYFYGLPKVDKSVLIMNATKEQNSEYICCKSQTDLKFRPIVGGPNSTTQRLSHFMDIILKPLCNNVSSYIRDDFDFLHILPKHVEKDATLVTFDIVSLYTNIPHQLGMEAIQYWLKKDGCNIDKRFDENFIIEAVKLILDRNIFYFNGLYYTQIQGTAMGTKVAPTYATLVLGYLEEKLYAQMANKHGLTVSTFLRENFKRFLDDCFMICPPEVKIQLLYQELNMLHPSLNFTFESSDEELPFLDVLVKLKDGVISTDIYSQCTDTKNYLEFSSCHAKHTKVNIPFNLASWVVSGVSDPVLRECRLQELIIDLKRQNYPDSLIRQGIGRTKEKGPILRTRSVDRNTDNIISFVTTFNPNNVNMFNVLKIHEPTLRKSEKMEKILDKRKIINCKRQAKNLKQLLCNSKFDAKQQVCTVSKCGVSRFKNGKTFTVKYYMNCKTRNVIYSLICQKCGDFYIGQTSCELRQRMTLHRQQTKTDDLRFLRVNEHFHDCSKNNFLVYPLYKVLSGNSSVRDEREKCLIRLLKPTLNSNQ